MKITQEQQEQGQELYQELVQKAWESSTFKEQLINNPNLAIEKVTGRKVNFDKMDSDNIKFKVEDQSDPNIIYLNIPQKIDLENVELTPEQLEMISGGDGGFFDGLGYALMDHAILQGKLIYYVVSSLFD